MLIDNSDVREIHEAFYGITKRLYIGKIVNATVQSPNINAWLKRMSDSSLDMYHMLLVVWNILHDEEITLNSRVNMKNDIGALLESIDRGKKEEVHTDTTIGKLRKPPLKNR